MFCRLRTVNRFFSLHVIVPLIVIALIMMHLFFLHQQVSSVGSGSFSWGTSFHNVLRKDVVLVVCVIMLISLSYVVVPNYFMDAEN